jgi:hypothetical protein
LLNLHHAGRWPPWWGGGLATNIQVSEAHG